MKTVLLTLALCLLPWTVGCSTPPPPDPNHRVEIHKTTVYQKTFNGHKYLIAEYAIGFAGGCAMIHDESCPCKDKP